MRKAAILVSVIGAVAACGGGGSQRPQLRATLDRAEITLVQAIERAMVDRDGAPISAALLMNADPVWQVGVFQTEAKHDVRVHMVSGAVLSAAPVGPASAPCPSAIPVAEALSIAEQTAGGDAVAVVPDDDVACAFEIQVLAGVTLWEVKVAGDGGVLEHELSDEYGGSEED